MRLLSNIVPVVLDAIAFARNLVRSQGALAAENLFLRKQLTFFFEREQTPRRTDNATRFTMAAVAWVFDWKKPRVGYLLHHPVPLLTSFHTETAAQILPG